MIPWQPDNDTSEPLLVSCIVMVTITRTEELGEDDISFKMINENATLVRMCLPLVLSW